MQSPVFINSDAVPDIDGNWPDWQDWSEVDVDYYDQATSNTKRRKLHHPNDREVAPTMINKSPKTASIKGLPQLSLGEPVSASSDKDGSFPNRSIVRWKVRQDSPKLPLLEHGEHEKVSILKDWKERFKPPPLTEEGKGKPTSSNGAQRAVAVVIETRNSPSVPAASNWEQDLDDQARKSNTTLPRRNKISKDSGNAKLEGACPPKQNGITASRKRKLSPSPETRLEPVPKRQSTRQHDAVSQRKATAQVGQKRRASEKDEPEPPPKRVKMKTSDDNVMKKDVPPKPSDNAATRKENIRPKPSENVTMKKENTQPKHSGSAATKKGNVRPKVMPAGRRSTRPK